MVSRFSAWRICDSSHTRSGISGIVPPDFCCSPASVAKLDAFATASTNIYLPMTDAAFTRAAQLWASIRQAGQTTAADPALDGDVILMAQVLEANFPEGGYVIVTDKVKHFQGWVNADKWQNITP